jgi:hypothetical protein
MSSEGTPLDALETGEISNSADEGRMAAILRDMNASGADVGGGGASQQQQQQLPMPVHALRSLPPPIDARQMGAVPQQSQQSQHYVQVDDESRVEEVKPRRKNLWSAVVERIRDPLFVAMLVFILSLPVLHTAMSKVVPWAFAVGGQLSYIGLITISLLAGGLFGLYKASNDLVGF